MKSYPLAVQCLSIRRAEGMIWAAALLALTDQASGAEATLVDKAKQFFGTGAGTQYSARKDDRDVLNREHGIKSQVTKSRRFW